MPSRPDWKTRTWVIIGISVIALLFASAYVYDYSTQYGTAFTKTYNYTIYFEMPPSRLAGMNGSYYSASKQLTISVPAGSLVSIKIVNAENSSEIFGLAVSYYADNGILPLSPGHSSTLSFFANLKGYFKIYCNVLNSLNPQMQNSYLVVN